MKSLREQLLEILPQILPAKPDDALGGMELLEKVRPKLSGKFADNSIRQYFSDLASGGESSPIARRAGQYGYYLRTNNGAAVVAVPKSPVELSGRDSQPEEKFRALFCHFHEARPEVFAKSIEHTLAKRQAAGLNKWKFPDVVLLEWDPAVIAEDGERLIEHMVDLRHSLGAQPFWLRSVELKVAISAPELREIFFQCVSNSKWAHTATLAIAHAVTDDSVADELRRLGSSYGVEVVSFGLDLEGLSRLPEAGKLRALSDKDREEQLKRIEVHTIASGIPRPTLDWQHVADLRAQNPEFDELFRWIVSCVKDRRMRSFVDWKKREQL
jgi:hypothetical protein